MNEKKYSWRWVVENADSLSYSDWQYNIPFYLDLSDCPLDFIDRFHDDFNFLSFHTKNKSMTTEISEYMNKYSGIVGIYDEEGLLHNEIGPALTLKNGTQNWFIHGKRHREDGPAILYPNGDYEYFIDNKRHNSKGYAFCIRGDKQYYLYNHRIDSYDKLLELSKYSYNDKYPFTKKLI